MVDSHGGITVAPLRDVSLRKRCVAFYIVYVYCVKTRTNDQKIFFDTFETKLIDSLGLGNFESPDSFSLSF